MTVGHFLDRALEAAPPWPGPRDGTAAPPSAGGHHQTKALIRAFEPLYLHAHQEAGGPWTIGYGHTLTARPGTIISSETAERLLDGDLARLALALTSRLPDQLLPHQRAALMAFSFNVGVDTLLRSRLLGALLEGDSVRAAAEFFRWYGGVRQGRQSGLPRRLAERALFLGQDWRPWQGWQPYPALSLGCVPTTAAAAMATLQIQTCLNQAGLAVCPDGCFGPETDAALRRFQGDRHLTVDGIAGPITQAALAVPHFAIAGGTVGAAGVEASFATMGSAPKVPLRRNLADQGRDRALSAGTRGRLGRIAP